jgi:ubiquinol-cytochrome c reductase cytochrome b subunit
LRAQPKDKPSGADLDGFASREWLAGLLDPRQIDGPHYYGGTKFENAKMSRFVKKDVAGFGPEPKAQLQKVIAALSAEASLKSQRDADGRDKVRCAECHQFHKTDPDATAPDLTGYGSREWLAKLIANPAHPSFYGKRNDRMPAFGADKILDDKSINLLTDWLRGEWYTPAR